MASHRGQRAARLVAIVVAVAVSTWLSGRTSEAVAFGVGAATVALLEVLTAIAVSRR